MTPPREGGDKTQNLARAYYQACVERDEARAEVERLRAHIADCCGHHPTEVET